MLSRPLVQEAELLVQKGEMITHLAHFLPAPHLPLVVRHDEFCGGVAPKRRLVGVPLAAVRQHLPIAVASGAATVLLPKRTDSLALWSII